MSITSDVKIDLKILCPDDVSESYVDWYKNEAIIQFSDNQYRSFSLKGQKEYVESMLSNQNSDLYGIFDSDVHIGNILIKDLLSPHRRSEITYVIGNKDYWNLGLASSAICMITELARSKYNLNKIYAGVAHKNTGSIKALKKNDFQLEGIRQQHLFYNSEWCDQHDFGLIL